MERAPARRPPASTLVITNGDGAVERLAAAGIGGRLLPWRDMLHDGPVPATVSRADLGDVRAAFLSSALGLDPGTVRGDFAVRDAVLEAHATFERVELWFEHDLYDQLQLIQLIDYFAGEQERDGLFLVQASHYLGVMPPIEVQSLAACARPVTTTQLEAGRAAWAAFTAPTPRALAGLAGRPVPDLPHLAPALTRLLEELPEPHSGLSLTEARILGCLTGGPAKVAAVYAAVHRMDEAQFLADLPFFLRLDGLCFTHEPLITGLPFRCGDCGPLSFRPGEGQEGERLYRTYAAAEIALTRAGQAALAGRFDHAGENAVTRWIGGTELRPGALWRYERDARRLVEPN